MTEIREKVNRANFTQNHEFSTKNSLPRKFNTNFFSREIRINFVQKSCIVLVNIIITFIPIYTHIYDVIK